MPRVFCFVIVGSFGEFVLDLERGVLGTGDFDFLDDFFQNEIVLLRTKNNTTTLFKRWRRPTTNQIHQPTCQLTLQIHLLPPILPLYLLLSNLPTCNNERTLPQQQQTYQPNQDVVKKTLQRITVRKQNPKKDTLQIQPEWETLKGN